MQGASRRWFGNYVLSIEHWMILFLILAELDVLSHCSVLLQIFVAVDDKKKYLVVLSSLTLILERVFWSKLWAIPSLYYVILHHVISTAYYSLQPDFFYYV